MHIISIGSPVQHIQDQRKGEVVDLKGDRARVRWLVGPNGTNYTTGAVAMASRIKRTWVKLSVLHLIPS